MIIKTIVGKITKIYTINSQKELDDLGNKIAKSGGFTESIGNFTNLEFPLMILKLLTIENGQEFEDYIFANWPEHVYSPLALGEDIKAEFNDDGSFNIYKRMHLN